MSTTRSKRLISAPLERVFDTIAHIEVYSKAIPAIVEVEPLSEVTSGVGTRFRETRRMGKRRASTELEVTEYVKNESVRLVADQGGTIWDTVFSTRATPDGTELEMVMEARAYRLMAKLMNPLIKGMVARAIEQDMDAVKSYCEGSSPR